MDLVSIIVPVFNVEAYIDRCIKSLVEQKYRELQIILVNDGSKDGSLEICELWAKRDARIQIINQDNSGVSVARNRGLDIAQGEWVCFVDGDDYLSTNMISTMIDSIKRQNLDMLMCGYTTNNDEALTVKHFFIGDQRFSEKNYGDLIRMCVGIDLTRQGKLTNIGVPWAKLYRKSFISKHELRFDPELRRMQDMIFTIQVLCRNPRVAYIDQPLYYYCMRMDSAIHKYTANYHVTANRILSTLESVLSDCTYITDKKEIISFKAVCLLIEMLRLEYLHDSRKVGYWKGRKIIREVSKASPYIEGIKERSYSYFDLKRKLFKFVMKIHCYGVAYYIIQINKVVRRAKG